jgi:hypothetical protein
LKAESRFSGASRHGIYLFADLAVVASFALIGRDSHNESVGLGEVFHTAAPFLLALTGAWLTPIVHRTPWRILSGIAAGIITTVLGLYFRAVVFSEGISGMFPVVTAAYVMGLMALPRVVGSLRSIASAT